VTQLLAPRRYLMSLLVGFALSALLLAAIGVYGVTSYAVAQRTSEIGVRMALGASPARIVRHVVWQGTALAIAGVAIGLAGAAALSGLAGSLLFETSPLDPATMVAVPLLLLAIALVACLVPARRGARIQPSVAMRAD
jgi:ABC-type antimicrobial peptide transport system permease subunit